MTSHILSLNLSLINGVARGEAGARDSPLPQTEVSLNCIFCIILRLLSYLLSVFRGFYRFLPLQYQIPTHITVLKPFQCAQLVQVPLRLTHLFVFCAVTHESLGHKTGIKKCQRV